MRNINLFRIDFSQKLLLTLKLVVYKELHLLVIDKINNIHNMVSFFTKQCSITTQVYCKYGHLA